MLSARQRLSDLALDKLNEIMDKIPGGKIQNLQLEHVDFAEVDP